MDLFEFDWLTFRDHGFKLIVAFLIALPVGWDRENSGRSAGLRTFPLVAVAACAYLLITREILTGNPEAQARVLSGLITGIGFIGGGAILKNGNRVEGTATAAGIWITGAIGASIAYGRLDVGVILSLVTFATLRWLPQVPTLQSPDGEGDAP